MGLTQLVKDVGGTIEAYFLDGLPGAVKMSLFARDEDDESSTYGELVTKLDDVTATRDLTDTTLAVAASAGDRQITISDSAHIIPGRLYKVGVVNSGEPEENVRIKSLYGTVATLTAPLRHRHASGVDFVGLRAWYAVTAATADYWWANGYAKFISDDDIDPPQDPVVEHVDCVLFKIPERLVDVVDVKQVEPLIESFIGRDLDVALALRQARDGMLIDLGAERCRWSLGSSVLMRAASLRFCLDRQHAAGRSEEIERRIAGWNDDYANELNRLRKLVPVDSDNDGEPNEPDDDQTLDMEAL